MYFSPSTKPAPIRSHGGIDANLDSWARPGPLSSAACVQLGGRLRGAGLRAAQAREASPLLTCFVCNIILKIDVWQFAQRFTLRAAYTFTMGGPGACLSQVGSVECTDSCSEEALGGGGGSLCAWARLAGRRLSVSSSRGQSSCGYSLTTQTEAPGDPLVFSLFPCPRLLLS